MHVSDLPASELVGIGIAADEIARLLARAVGKQFPNLDYYMLVKGAPRSGRVLLQKQHPEAAQLPPLNLDEIGEDFIELNTQARRDPATMLGGKPAWEVRRTLVDNTPAAIVWAVWST